MSKMRNLVLLTRLDHRVAPLEDFEKKLSGNCHYEAVNRGVSSTWHSFGRLCDPPNTHFFPYITEITIYLENYNIFSDPGAHCLTKM